MARRRRRRTNAGALLIIVVAVAAVLFGTAHRPSDSSPGGSTLRTLVPVPKASASGAHGAGTSRAKPSRARRQAAGALSLIVEPDAGVGPVYDLLRSARHSVELEIYELEDDQATAMLAADARRGVRVRVLLNQHVVGHYNQPAFSYLQAHGVAVRWAPARFDFTHEKAIVVDGRRAAVMSMNLTARYYADTRDFVVLDSRRADVTAIAATFARDWAGGGPASSPAGLLWSPGAQDALVGLIDSARHRLLVENEEMNDDAVTNALLAAARRGVNVEVVMTRQRDWYGVFTTLARAGVDVRTYASSAPLYIHAKAIVADPGGARARAFVGSQNFSSTSLLYNRELGIVTARPTIVAGLTAVIVRDGAGAARWRP